MNLISKIIDNINGYKKEKGKIIHSTWGGLDISYITTSMAD